jgi:hypothetical protein
LQGQVAGEGAERGHEEADDDLLATRDRSDQRCVVEGSEFRHIPTVAP